MVLLPLSIAAYGVHYAIYGNAHDIFYYLLMDVAFLFVQGLLVTLVIEQLLSARERRAVLMKLNVVMGVFYSEVGTVLLRELSAFDARVGELAPKLLVRGTCSSSDFALMRAAVQNHSRSIDARGGDLGKLKLLLEGKRDFLVRLLENPGLMEHDRFTELLWAVFHLAEELSFRRDLGGLTAPDRRHLEGDIQRALELLAREWLGHVEHLQRAYPYLFSLAVRTNPFDSEARVEVRE
jgi:hypothetical protein